MSLERVPEELRREVAGDLRPVRPLPRPWLRTLYLLPVALLVVSVVLRRDLRFDADQIGGLLLWGLSVVQALAGLGLLAAALRESLPGEALSRRHLLAGVGVVLLWLAGVSWATWSRSPTLPPSGQEAYYWAYCTGWPLALALPVAIAALLLARRAFPLRPALVGALCGAGAGLVVDAAWRTYCEVSQLQHILSAHMLALVLVTAAGAMLGAAIGRRG